MQLQAVDQRQSSWTLCVCTVRSLRSPEGTAWDIVRVFTVPLSSRPRETCSQAVEKYLPSFCCPENKCVDTVAIWRSGCCWRQYAWSKKSDQFTVHAFHDHSHASYCRSLQRCSCCNFKITVSSLGAIVAHLQETSRLSVQVYASQTRLV